MRLINEKKININSKIYYPVFLCLGLIILISVLGFYSSKKNSTNEMLLGKWEVKEITWRDGSSEYVPDNERYILNLQVIKNKNQFNVDDVQGEWKLEDSSLILENIPESRTYIDSIFVVNDAFGNSSVVLKNGNQKIATISEGKIQPEKVISAMQLISINFEELNLSKDGNIYKYKKLIK